MVRQLQGSHLESWLRSVRACHIPELRRFANGVERDKAAVLVGLTLAHNNGQTEGQVTRIKLIKRMMYGRAGFALFRQRVVHRFSYLLVRFFRKEGGTGDNLTLTSGRGSHEHASGEHHVILCVRLGSKRREGSLT